MEYLVKEEVFERSSFPQLGPLFAVALGLIAVFDPVDARAGIEQLTGSFRTPSSITDTVHERPSHPQSAPLRTIPENLYRDLFTVNEWAAIQHEVNTFRSAEGKKLQLWPYEWHKPGWLTTAVKKDSAANGVTDSTRVDIRVYPRTDFPQIAPLFAEELGLTAPFDPVVVVAPVKQQIESVRTREILADPFERTDFPQSAPLSTIAENLYRDLFETQFWPAIDHQRSVFKSTQRELLQPQFYTQPGFAWLDAVLVFDEVPQFSVAARQLTESFRSKDAPQLDTRRTDFPQSAPLRTIPLDLYRDQFETAFWPTIAHQLSVFRSDQRELLQPQIYTEPAFSWLEIPADLLEIKKRFAATRQLTESYHSDPRALLLLHGQHLTQLLFPPILRDAINLPNFQIPIFVVEGIVG